MIKITFLGAGSTVFAKNVLGDVMRAPALCECEIALYDISPERLEESFMLLSKVNANVNQNRATIKQYLGVENRKGALKDANFVVNAVQIGGYRPSTVIDFDIPTNYGLKQTIADTIGVGGIMRALGTIPVMREFANDIQEVCPDTLFLNYSNPMAMLTGYMQRYTNVNTIGLCHSVQTCVEDLLTGVGMRDKLEGHKELIAGINHMSWLLKITDKEGNDLYPEIKKRALAKNINEKHTDMVRYEYIKYFGHYCTESSEHNAEYNSFFIKHRYPELIDRFNIPIDEYKRRCELQIEGWNIAKDVIAGNIAASEILGMDTGGDASIEQMIVELARHIDKDGTIIHTRSLEYASRIMEAIVTNQPYKIGGNVLNTNLIDNFPNEACVEVPCLVDGSGITPCHVGSLPVHLAAMNMTNINPQLMTIQAAVSRKKEDIYRAVMLDPHTSAELSLEDIVKMCDEMIEAHGEYMEMYT
ncbi:alpha-glucosidase/alpha-galactosidase [bacterium]|nr:alpha-glucosidase/alpha-galactosidase [bacterium]